MHIFQDDNKSFDNQSFNALVVNKSSQGTTDLSIQTKQLKDLSDGEVLIRVHYSCLNYKDIMSCKGDETITQHYPHTPGIDCAGIVAQSTHSDISSGDKVMVYSRAMGMTVSGGFSEYVRVPAKWCFKLDEAADLEKTMVFGTAGFTAGLAVDALLKQGLNLSQSKIIVNGASGGVGIISTRLLAQLGANVTAITSNPDFVPILKSLGARQVLMREKMNQKNQEHMLIPRWDGAIDVAGGDILANTVKMMKENGVVIATGMAASKTVDLSVLPFILRGIKLIGINAENVHSDGEKRVWERLLGEWCPKLLTDLYKTTTLDALPQHIEDYEQGLVFGRLVIDMRGK